MLKGRSILLESVVLVLPALLGAQDATSATLRTRGVVLVNGTPTPATSAVFPHDTIETRSGSEDSAIVTATGMKVVVLPDTIVLFEGNELVLEHGRLQADTSTGLRIRVGCLMVVPVTTDFTSYDVSDTEGNVNISALRLDVRVDPQAATAKKTGLASSVIVHEGQQTTKTEKCGGARLTPVSATDPILDSPMAVAIGSGVGVGVVIWVVSRSDDPASPAIP
jgi:hypothetical protein